MVSIEDAYHRCVSAFAMQAYEECSGIGLALLDDIYNVDFYHVLINSLARCGRDEEAGQVALQGLNTFESVPWEKALLTLSTGHAVLGEVAPGASDALQACRAHYYAGSRRVTDGKLEEGVVLLEGCLAIAGNAQVDCLERQLARAELAFIEQHMGKTVASLDMRRCVEAFVRQDYRDSVKLAVPLAGKIVSPDLCHMLLISLHRLGMIKERDEYGALFFKLLSPFGEWQCLLLSLTLGKVPVAAVLSRAAGDEQHCQAHYYEGARLISLGQIAAG